MRSSERILTCLPDAIMDKPTSHPNILQPVSYDSHGMTTIEMFLGKGRVSKPPVRAVPVAK